MGVLCCTTGTIELNTCFIIANCVRNESSVCGYAYACLLLIIGFKPIRKTDGLPKLQRRIFSNFLWFGSKINIAYKYSKKGTKSIVNK